MYGYWLGRSTLVRFCENMTFLDKRSGILVCRRCYNCDEEGYEDETTDIWWFVRTKVVGAGKVRPKSFTHLRTQLGPSNDHRFSKSYRYERWRSRTETYWTMTYVETLPQRTLVLPTWQRRTGEAQGIRKCFCFKDRTQYSIFWGTREIPFYCKRSKIAIPYSRVWAILRVGVHVWIIIDWLLTRKIDFG